MSLIISAVNEAESLPRVREAIEEAGWRDGLRAFYCILKYHLLGRERR